MSKSKVPNLRRHAGVGFFAIAQQERREKKLKKEDKKNARARLKGTKRKVG
jgi:hypothetical protein